MLIRFFIFFYKTLSELVMVGKKCSVEKQSKRKAVRATIAIKKDLIAKHESGIRVCELATMFDMPKSTVCTIIKNKAAIKAADVAKGVTTLTARKSKNMEQKEEIAEEISSGEEEGEAGRISTAEIQDLLTMWSKTQEVVEKWHPDRALVNRCVNLFNDNIIEHFRKIKKGRQHQSTLERWLSTTTSDPKPSTSGERLRYETPERIPDVIMEDDSPSKQ